MFGATNVQARAQTTITRPATTDKRASTNKKPQQSTNLIPHRLAVSRPRHKQRPKNLKTPTLVVTARNLTLK